MKSNFWSAKRNALVAALALFASQPALADDIQIQGWWSGAGNVALTLADGTNYHTGIASVSFSEYGGAGGFQTYNATTRQTFQAWCVDIFHDFNFGNPGSTSDTSKDGMSVFGQQKANDLGRLYTLHHDAIDARTSTANASSAFQLAVWEIVNEKSGTYSLTTGAFTASGTGAGDAQSWLSDLNTNHASTQFRVNIWSVTNNTFSSSGVPTWGAQDLAVFAPVPEPETYVMMLAGLGLLGFTARRRLQQRA